MVVWEHARPCRPTAADSKPDSEAPASGPSVRPVGNGPPSCSPRVVPRPRSPGSWTSRARAPAAGTPAGKAQGLRHCGAADPTGRRPKIPDSALEGIEQALLEGALAHGFATDVWTLDRIAMVIQGLTGVALSNPSAWRLLRNRLGWTVQRPQRQAKERDEEAIQHWVAHEWPRIKKGPRRIGLACLLRRIRHLADPTGAAHLVGAWPHADPAPPDGLEAGLHGRRARLPPDGGPRRGCASTCSKTAYDTDSLIKVLEQLKGFYAGQQVVLLWDGLSSHWSHKMRAHLDAQRDWLTVERLPAYAPELNPVEYLWDARIDRQVAWSASKSGQEAW